MIFKKIMIFKLSFFVLLIFLFTSCSYKNLITRTTNFNSMISDMVDESEAKIKQNLIIGDVVLVSDFVNLDNLKNKSQLGFLLSNILKDKLSSLNIIVREIELGKEFEFGKSGFNLLTREKNKIISNGIQAKYAVVGTYSISNKSLNVFIKLIEIETGYILSSSFSKTYMDDEIMNLEGYSNGNNLRQAPTQIRTPIVL